jgi:hypothetical protein
MASQVCVWQMSLIRSHSAGTTLTRIASVLADDENVRRAAHGGLESWGRKFRQTDC